MRATRDSATGWSVSAALEAITAGWGGHLWTGEAGSGKSILLERCVDGVHAASGSAIIVRVTASTGQQSPGAVLDGLLTRVRLTIGHPDATSIPTSPIAASAHSADPETLALVVRAELATLAMGRTVVVVADDIDLMDSLGRRVLLNLATIRGSGVVLLGTARDERSVRPAPHPLRLGRVGGLDASATYRLLTDEEDLAVAPHIAATLADRLSGNIGAILETAHALTSDQLAGVSALPDPLPVTPALSAVFGAALSGLDDRERHALLVAAVSVSNRTDSLLRATGMSITELISGPLSTLLELVSGSFRFADPRLRALAHGLASVAERTRAHESLAAACEPTLTPWHASLAALAGRPGIAPSLVALARRALDRGDSEWAYRVAREATSQAVGGHRVTAELVAGIAALHSGLVRDAAYWLGRVIRSDKRDAAAHALAPYAAAVAFANGFVPDAEVERAADKVSANGRVAASSRRALVAAFAVTAALHAERADVASATRALDHCRALSAESGAGRDLATLSERWCGLFGIGNPQETGSPRQQPAVDGFGIACAGLELAVRGETAAAERLLAGSIVSLARQSDDRIAATPLVESHLRVALALVEVASGRYSRAAESITAAAWLGPIALPFAGLGIAASRRIDVITVGTGARHDPAVESASVRREALVDQAFLAMFASRTTEAAAFMSMANELPNPGVPGLLPAPDEAELWLAADQGARATAVRTALPEGSPARWRAGLALARPETLSADTVPPGLASPWERALGELSLGRALARAGDAHRSRTHVLASIEQFFHSGATAMTAWARTIAIECELPASDTPGGANPVDVEWATELTERERQVASLVVLGTSNRDVATTLHLSVRTVEVHLARVFSKLDVHSRTELSHRAHLGGPAAVRGLRRTT